LSAVPARAGKLSYGINVGALMSNVTGTPEGWEGAKSYRTTMTGGVLLNYAYNESFSLQPEIVYASKGFVGHPWESDWFDVDATASFDYIEIPVLARYSFMPGGKFRPCVFAGASLSYCMASELEISQWPGSVTIDISSLTHTTDFGLILGAGFGYEAGPGTLTLDVRYQNCFTNVVTTGDFEINGSVRTIDVDDFKNYGFAFLVGYRI
jgi:hypothetical protein